MADASPQPLLNDFEPASYEAWRAAAEALLKGAPFERRMLTPTVEGVTLQPIYRAEDAPAPAPLPGFEDRRRGAGAEGYAQEPWVVSQEIPEGLPSDFNAALRADLMRGQTGVNILLDVASQEGKDPDSALPGEVGACGLSVGHLNDLREAFAGIVPEAVPFHLQAGASALPLAALFLAWVDGAASNCERLSVAFNCDPLAYLLSAGHLPVSANAAFDEMAALVDTCQARGEGLSAIGVSALPIANGGGSAVEEVAYALAAGTQYLRELQARGAEIDTAASGMVFSFALGPMFFMEVAKLRAARQLWHRIVTALGGSEAASGMRIHARTTLWNKTATDPYVNMLRTATEALSGVVGGVQSMHVGCFDEVVRVPDTFSRRMARNTQVILAEECELTAVTDPAGGSWFIESLTEELAKQAWTYFQEIEKAGGALEAIKAGSIQERVAGVRDKRQQLVNSRRQSLVGTNVYANLDEQPLPPRVPDYGAIQAKRAKELEQLRSTNGEANDLKILEALQNLVNLKGTDRTAALLEAARAGATLGELSRALRVGEQPLKATAIPSVRGSAPYEELRRASARYTAEQGHPPKLALACVNVLKRHKPRMDFTVAFFAAGGFVPEPLEANLPAEEAAAAVAASGMKVVVICGADADYPEYVPAFCRALKAKAPEATAILAGDPGEHASAFAEAGLDDHISIKSPNYAVNRKYLEKVGVL
ncbi:MAG: methylmalonyl-CoA mutase family protein [Opitutales bacterium]